MSFVTTLEQAREFLLLAPEVDAAAVLRAAQDREAELRATSSNPKAPMIGRNAAAKKLKQLLPLLPMLQVEAELAALESSSGAPTGTQIHKIRLEQKKLAERVNALPDGDEKTIFLERLTVVHEALQPKTQSHSVPPVAPPAPEPVAPPPPPPPPPKPDDPALAVFAGKVAVLRNAIEQKETSKSRLNGYLAEARGVASVLRDEADRQRAVAQLGELAQAVDQLLAFAAETPPPFEDPTERILTGKIRTLRAAIDRRDRSRAPFLLESARDLVPALRSRTSRDRFDGELTELEGAVEDLLAPPPADPAEARSAEVLASVRSALVRGDLPAATALLTDAAAAIAAVQNHEVRKRREVELAEAKSQLARLKAEADAQAARLKAEAEAQAAKLKAEAEAQAARAKAAAETEARNRAQLAAVTEKLNQARQAVGRGEQAEAQKLLGEAHPLASALADRAAREQALGDIARLAAEAAAIKPKPPPQPPPPPSPPAAPPQPAPSAQPEKPAPASVGFVLRLIPKENSVGTGLLPPPLRFVARPRFLLGREESERHSRADFLAPKSFGQVGRVNATLSRKNDEIFIQDGDGQKKSTNGSKLDDELLPANPVPASFKRDRTILLSTVFSLTARHLLGEAPGGPPIDTQGQSLELGRTIAISTLTGAVRFQPVGELPMPVIAVWLFTDATLGSLPTCAVVLRNSGLADTQARVHHWQDKFWIENLRSGAGVKLGEQPLPKGVARQLRGGDLLTLGNITYEVHIEE